jgi:hypothetical protein
MFLFSFASLAIEMADFASLLRRSSFSYEGRIAAYGYDG